MTQILMTLAIVFLVVLHLVGFNLSEWLVRREYRKDLQKPSKKKTSDNL